MPIMRSAVVMRTTGIGATRSPHPCRRRTGFHPERTPSTGTKRQIFSLAQNPADAATARASPSHDRFLPSRNFELATSTIAPQLHRQRHTAYPRGDDPARSITVSSPNTCRIMSIAC